MTIEDKIAEITLDAKQAEQVRHLFNIAFMLGIAFRENIPDINPSDKLFENAKQLFLFASQEEVIREIDHNTKEIETRKQ